MAKEIGPRELALREMREANIERKNRKPASLQRLKAAVAKVPAKKVKKAKKKAKR